METTRRFAVASIAAMVAGLPIRAKAQFTEQEVRNGLQVTTTGDVRVNQDAAGNQEIVSINGTAVNGDGIYQTTTGQVIVNDGQITSTGDVDVVQRASGNQSVVVEVPVTSKRASVCNPGAVLASPGSGKLFYQGEDCCWWPVPCCCDGGGCR